MKLQVVRELLVNGVDCDESDVEEYFEVDQLRKTSRQVDDENDDSDKIDGKLPPQVILHDLNSALNQIAQLLELSDRSHQHHIDDYAKNADPVDDESGHTLSLDRITVV